MIDGADQRQWPFSGFRTAASVLACALALTAGAACAGAAETCLALGATNIAFKGTIRTSYTRMWINGPGFSGRWVSGQDASYLVVDPAIRVRQPAATDCTADDPVLAEVPITASNSRPNLPTGPSGTGVEIIGDLALLPPEHVYILPHRFCVQGDPASCFEVDEYGVRVPGRWVPPRP